MMQNKRTFRVGLIALVCLVAIGCNNKFWDPTQIGRWQDVPVKNVILSSLGAVDEESTVYEGAEEPKPADIVTLEQDYVFSPGDIVRINIYELYEEGTPFISDYVVTESGRISIPEVGQIQASGLSESQLEEEIRQILTPNILKNPSVTVILQSSQKRVYSIYGRGVGQPGRYAIPRHNFRLADAVATAGGVAEFNVSYIYVTRQLTPAEIEKRMTDADESSLENGQINIREIEPGKGLPRKLTPEEELLEIIAPAETANDLVIASAEMVSDDELESLIAPDGVNIKNEKKTENVAPAINNALTKEKAAAKQEEIEWVFENGKWVPVRKGGVAAEPGVEDVQIPENQIAGKMPRLEERLPEGFGFEEEQAAMVQTRVIKVPVDKLTGGDPQFNIVIKAGDTISVPLDVIGECTVMGNVNRVGYIELTGRPMTLMQAIAAAGGLGPLAAPQNVEVRRRIGRDNEIIVQVNLAKIAEGTQPDFFIKKHDTINVGTDSTARWRAVLRNSFRATYGFGFIYDRNFADRDVLSSRPFPNWF